MALGSMPRVPNARDRERLINCVLLGETNTMQ